MSDADLFTDEPAPSAADLFTDEPAPKTADGFADNVLTDALHNLNPLNIVKSGAELLKQGFFDIPKAAAESSIDATKGIAHAIATGETPDADELNEDVKNSPIVKQAHGMIDPIAKDPADYGYKHPVSAAMLLAAPALGLIGGEGAASEAADTAEAAKAAERPSITDSIPTAGKDEDKPLPEIAPGAKTGDPHALFAYNDNFGPGGTPRPIYNVFGDPEHPAIKAVGHASSVTPDVLEKNGIPITGQQPGAVAKYGTPVEGTPRGTPEPLVPIGGKEVPGAPPSKLPPDPNAPKPPPAPSLASAVKGAIPQSVKDYIASKSQAAMAKPGFMRTAGKYLKEEANKLDAHDLGLQMRQVQKMGSGYKGLEQANQLIDYARDNNYLRPGLSDIARRGEIEGNLNKYGQNVGAIRKIADSRGAPDLPGMRATLEKQLTGEFGIDAPNEIQKVLAKFDKKAKEDPTFSGMADLATELNKAKTPTKDLAQHPGPTTEGANIIGRENNNAIRGVLKPEESSFYTQNLRDFGAHKKLEQVTAGAARRGLTARTNQRGVVGRMFQEALDRGGYRMGSRIASGTGSAMASGLVHTLPEFFEQLAHQSDDAVDDVIGGMAKGGVVPDDVRTYVGKLC